MGLFWLSEGKLTPFAPAVDEDDHELHPARLAEDIMTCGVETVEADERLDEALRRMKKGRFRHLPVADGGRLVGILSDRDGLQLGPEGAGLTVEQAMSTELITAAPTTEIRALARAVVDHRISCLPVLDDDGFLVGIVTTVDLLRSMAHRAPVDLWI